MPKSNRFILLYDLSLAEQAYKIAPGLRLQRLEAPLTVPDLAILGSSGFSSWPALAPFVTSCTAEIFSMFDPDVTQSADTMRRAQLLSHMLNLLGYSGHLCVACASYSWNAIAGLRNRIDRTAFDQSATDQRGHSPEAIDIILPLFEGRLLEAHMNIMVPKDSRKEELTPSDARWIKDHFVTMDILTTENENIRYALEAAIDWRYLKDPRAAIARLWSGIEAIFSIKGELIYRISLVAASLLAPRGEKRVDQFYEFKKLYNLRSQAVHGEPMEEQRLLKATSDSYNLLCQLLRLILEKGRPLRREDLDRAVLT